MAQIKPALISFEKRGGSFGYPPLTFKPLFERFY